MTQLSSISNANPQQVSTGNGIKENEDILSPEIKKSYENETGPGKTEQLRTGGKTDPKPESTMHKVGRYLTKILGGLLLAAGVAAAAAATVMSFGFGGAFIAATIGVVTGALGLTGVSVIAGVAGAAGIGLLATSEFMRPDDPEALLPQKNFGDDKIEETVASLTKLDKGFKERPMTIQASAYMALILSELKQDAKTGPYHLKANADSSHFMNFIEKALNNYGVTKFEVNETNVLLARLAINQYFGVYGSLDQISSFNDEETVNSIRDFLGNEIKKYMPGGSQEDPEKLAKLKIFLGALTGQGVGGQAPQSPDGRASLMEENVPTVSMNAQGAEKLPFGKGAEKDVTQALKNIDPNVPTSVSYDNTYAAPVFASLGSIHSMNPDKDEVASFVTNVLKGGGVHDLKPTPKNILLVRRAIIHHCGLHPNDDAVNVLNSTEGRKACADRLQTLLKRKMDDDTRDAVTIFRIAVSEDDIANIKDENAKLLENQTSDIKG